MVLFLTLFIFLLINCSIRLSPILIFENIANASHLFCLSNLPTNMQSSDEINALVCAKNFTSLSASHLYVTSGLIHLFVVSGAHLLFIEKILNNLQKYQLITTQIILIFLTAYALACNLNPPIFRSLIGVYLVAFLSKKNIQWPTHIKILATGLLTLIFSPNWLSSLSFQMSWLASLALSFGSDFFNETDLVLKQSLFYFFLMPTIVFFQASSPIIILLNILIAPILEFILFPLGLLIWFFNFLSPMFDMLINFLKIMLQNVELSFQPATSTSNTHLVLFNWYLIAALHLIFHILSVLKNRKEI